MTAMATIRTEAHIDAPAAAVWDALADWGALHTRLVPGFVTDCHLDGEDRIVTFASGLTVREVLISRDDEQMRLVWSIVDGPYAHHNGAAQVIAEGSGCRFVWTTDLLPHAATAPTRAAMEEGTRALAAQAARVAA